MYCKTVYRVNTRAFLISVVDCYSELCYPWRQSTGVAVGAYPLIPRFTFGKTENTSKSYLSPAKA